MHEQVMEFIEKVKVRFDGEHFRDCAVHEVGSRNINGTVRMFFERCLYTGFDLGYGPCVDVVSHYSQHVKPESAYTIISCEALEHDRDWAKTVHAMIDNLMSEGLLIITAGGPGRPEHGVSDSIPSDSPDTLDYYGNITEEDFRAAIDLHPDFVMGDFKEYEFDVRDGDFRFWGVKA
jgi:hypothetical protein